MSHMPASAKAVRAMFLVIGAGSLVTAVWFVAAAVTLETGALGELVTGLLFLKALPFGALAGISIVTATKCSHGGPQVRIVAVVVGSLIATLYAIGVLVHDGSWSLGVAAGCILIVFSTGQDTRDWFDRWPR